MIGIIGKGAQFRYQLPRNPYHDCITGLTVVDTGSDFSIFGQVVLMMLIQIGGLSFMTFGVLIAVVMAKKIGLKERLLIQESANSLATQGVVRLSFFILDVSKTQLEAACPTFQAGAIHLRSALFAGIPRNFPLTPLPSGP